MILQGDVESIIKKCSDANDGDHETLKATWSLIQKSYNGVVGPDKPGNELAVIAAEAFLHFEDTKRTRECLDIYFGEPLQLDGVVSSEAEVVAKGSQKIDQYYVRALFVKGCLMQRSAVIDDNLNGSELQAQTIKAAQYIIQGMAMAQSPTVLGLERYSFLVYNGSVHFWRITHFLQCEGLRSLLLPHLQKVTDALAAVDTFMGSDDASSGAQGKAGPTPTLGGGGGLTKRGLQEWRARNLISLALCHLEAARKGAKGADTDALKCLDAAIALTKSRAMRKEIEAIKIRSFPQNTSKSAPAQSDADFIMAAELKLLGVENTKSAETVDGIEKNIRGIVDDLEKALKDNSFKQYRTLVLSSRASASLKNVAAQAAWLAAKKACSTHTIHDFVRMSADSDELKARLRAKLALCLHEFHALSAHDDLSRRFRLMRQLEQVLLGLIKAIQIPAMSQAVHARGNPGSTDGNPAGNDGGRSRSGRPSSTVQPVDSDLTKSLHDAVKLVWNIALPLLDEKHFSQHGGIVRTCFKLSTRGLALINSNNSYLRASMHMELAQHIVETPSGALAEASREIEKSLTFEYGARQSELDTGKTTSSSTMAATATSASLVDMLFERKLDRYLIPMKKVITSLKKSDVDADEEDGEEDDGDDADEEGDVNEETNAGQEDGRLCQFLDEAMVLVEQSRREKRNRRKRQGLLSQALDALQDFDDACVAAAQRDTAESVDDDEPKAEGTKSGGAAPASEEAQPSTTLRWLMYRRTNLFGAVVSLAYESRLHDILSTAAKKVLTGESSSDGDNARTVDAPIDDDDNVAIECLGIKSNVCYLQSMMYMDALKAAKAEFRMPANVDATPEKPSATGKSDADGEAPIADQYSSTHVDAGGETLSTGAAVKKPPPSKSASSRCDDDPNFSVLFLKSVLRRMAFGKRVHDIILKRKDRDCSKGLFLVRNGVTLLWNTCLPATRDGAYANLIAALEPAYEMLSSLAQTEGSSRCEEDIELQMQIGHALACGYEGRYLSGLQSHVGERDAASPPTSNPAEADLTRAWQLCESLLVDTKSQKATSVTTTAGGSMHTANRRRIVATLARLSVYKSTAVASSSSKDSGAAVSTTSSSSGKGASGKTPAAVSSKPSPAAANPLDALTTVMKNDTDAALMLIEMVSHGHAGGGHGGINVEDTIAKAISALEKCEASAPPSSQQSTDSGKKTGATPIDGEEVKPEAAHGAIHVELWTRLARAAHAHGKAKVAIQCAKRAVETAIPIAHEDDEDHDSFGMRKKRNAQNASGSFEENYWLATAYSVMGLALTSLPSVSPHRSISAQSSSTMPRTTPESIRQFHMLSVREMKKALDFAIIAKRADLVEHVCRLCWNSMLPLLQEESDTKTHVSGHADELAQAGAAATDEDRETAFDAELLSLLHTIIDNFPFDNSSTINATDEGHYAFRLGLLRAIMHVYGKGNTNATEDADSVLEGLRVLDDPHFKRHFPPSTYSELVKQKVMLCMKIKMTKQQLSSLAKNVTKTFKSTSSTALSNTGLLTSFSRAGKGMMLGSHYSATSLSDNWATIANKLPSAQTGDAKVKLEKIRDKYVYYHKSITCVDEDQKVEEDKASANDARSASLRLARVCEFAEWMLATRSPVDATTGFFSRSYVHDTLHNQLRQSFQVLGEKYDTTDADTIGTSESNKDYVSDMFALIRGCVLSIRTGSAGSCALDARDTNAMLAQKICVAVARYMIRAASPTEESPESAQELEDTHSARDTEAGDENQAAAADAASMDAKVKTNVLKQWELSIVNTMFRECVSRGDTRTQSKDVQVQSTSCGVHAKDVPVAMHSLVILLDTLESLAHYRDMLPVSYVLWRLAQTRNSAATSSVAIFAEVRLLRALSLMKMNISFAEKDARHDDDVNATEGVTDGPRAWTLDTAVAGVGAKVLRLQDQDTASADCGMSITRVLYEHAKNLASCGLYTDAIGVLTLAKTKAAENADDAVTPDEEEMLSSISSSAMSSVTSKILIAYVDVLLTVRDDCSEIFLVECLELLGTIGNANPTAVADIPKLCELYAACICRSVLGTDAESASADQKKKLQLQMAFLDMHMKVLENYHEFAPSECAAAEAALLFQKASLLLSSNASDSENAVSISRLATEKLAHGAAGTTYLNGVTTHVRTILTAVRRSSEAPPRAARHLEEATAILRNGLVLCNAMKDRARTQTNLLGDDGAMEMIDERDKVMSFVSTLDLLHIEIYLLLLQVSSSRFVLRSMAINSDIKAAFPRMMKKTGENGYSSGDYDDRGAKAVEAFLASSSGASDVNDANSPAALVQQMLVDATACTALIATASSSVPSASMLPESAWTGNESWQTQTPTLGARSNLMLADAINKSLSMLLSSSASDVIDASTIDAYCVRCDALLTLSVTQSMSGGDYDTVVRACMKSVELALLAHAHEQKRTLPSSPGDGSMDMTTSTTDGTTEAAADDDKTEAETGDLQPNEDGTSPATEGGGAVPALRITAKRSCEMLMLAQACTCRRALLRTFTEAALGATSTSPMHGAADVGSSVKRSNGGDVANKDLTLIKLITNQRTSPSAAYETQIAAAVEASPMVKSFVTGLNTSSSSFDTVVAALPARVLVVCLHMDGTSDDVVVNFQDNHNISKRFLRCAAVMRTTPAEGEDDTIFDAQLDLGITSDDILALMQSMQPRCASHDDAEKDAPVASGGISDDDATAADADKRETPDPSSAAQAPEAGDADTTDDSARNDAYRTAAEAVSIEWHDFLDAVETTFTPFTAWLASLLTQATQKCGSSGAGEGSGVHVCLLLDEMLHALPMESLGVFYAPTSAVRSISRDFSLWFGYERMLNASPTAPSGVVDVKTSEFKYIVHEKNGGKDEEETKDDTVQDGVIADESFQKSLLPFFSVGSGKSSTSAEGISLARARGKARLPSAEDVVKMIESTKAFVYRATSLFSTENALVDVARLKTGAAPSLCEASGLTIPTMCNAKLSGCRLAMLLGDVLCSTDTLSTSALPQDKRTTLAAQGSYVAAMVLSLRGVTSILMKNYLISAEDSYVTKQAKALLECMAPAPSASATGKQQQQQSSHQGAKVVAEAVKLCTPCLLRTTATTPTSLHSDRDATENNGKNDEDAPEDGERPASEGEKDEETVQPLVSPCPYVVYGLLPVKLALT